MSDQMPGEVSALDRYLANRAPSLLWSTNAVRAAVISSRVGLALMGLAVVIGISVAAAEGAVGLLTMIGPAIGGAINLAIGRIWRDRARRTAGDTQMPEPVWTFLHGLAVHVLGESYPFRASNLGYYPVSHNWSGWRVAPKAGLLADPVVGTTSSTRSAREILDPRVFELLNEAATYYNRVNGILARAPDGTASPIQGATRIQVAADQAMLDALKIASLMQRFTENIEPLRPSLEACTAALKEASELVGTPAIPVAQGMAPTDQAFLLRGMLDELRMESQARTELSEPPQAVVEQRGEGA